MPSPFSCAWFVRRLELPALYEDATAAGWIEEGETQQRLNWIPASAGMTSWGWQVL
jgi:hypothetical protein